MNNEFSQNRNILTAVKSEATVAEIVFWWAVRAALLYCGATNRGEAVFYFIVFVLTFAVDIIRLIFPKCGISYRMQTFICFLSSVSTVAAIGLGVLEKNPDFDLAVQLAGGIFSGAAGYYIAMALRKPREKNECLFVTFFTFCFAGTVTILRKLTEFFSDFLFGTNLCHVEFVEDNHWLYNVFGLAMSPNEQRPLLDTDEDFIFSIVGGVLSAAVVYLRFRLRSKELFVRKKRDALSFFKNIPSRIYDKICLEIEKVNADTSIFDRLFWWCIRLCMLYAFFEWDNRAEATLMLANFIGTFAVTLVHLVFPRESVLSKISYKTQSLITVIVFLGSYGGNYCFVYNIVPRFDLFLHFISGILCVMAGYYIALVLVEHKNRKDSFLIALFAFCFSCFIMPAWEVSEFIGDFIWGTSNQGFYWGPSDDSFFFKVFGHGVGNTQLYYLFDTVYDVLLAMLTTVITFVLLYVWLEYRRTKTVASSTEKEKVTC